MIRLLGEIYHVQTFAANFSKHHYAAEQQLKQGRFAPPSHRHVFPYHTGWSKCGHRARKRA
jgi:hypothetical protein